MRDKTIIPISELFYFGYIVILFFAKGIGLYDGQPIFRIILVFALICYVGKMVMTEFSIKEFLIVGILLAIGATTYLVSGEKGALIYILMVTGLKNIPLLRIFKVAFITWTLSFGGMVLLTVTHIIESPFKIHDKFGFGFLIRWGLGHSHPNVLHISYLTFVMLAVYLIGKQFNLKWFILLMIGNIYILLYSLSSTGFVVVCLYLALNLYWFYRKEFSLIEKVLVNAVLPGCLLLSFAAPLVLSGRAFDIVNRIVNTRLNLSRHFLTTTPASFFGTRTSEITSHWLTMDNSFVFAYVAYGAVLFVIIVLAYILIIHHYIKAKKGTELSLILATLVAGITEPFLFNLSFKNLSLFFFGELVFENKAEKSQKSVYFLPKKIRDASLSFNIDVAFINKKWEDLCSLYRSNRLRIITFSTVIGLVVAILCGLLMPLPDAYMAPRRYCDDPIGADWIYLESVEQAEAENIKVLAYIDNETVMHKFTGNIVGLERVRGTVTSGLLSGIFCSTVYLIILSWKTKGRNR